MLDLGNNIYYPRVSPESSIAAGIAFPVIGLCLLVARLVCNLVKKNRFGASDFFAAVSWIFLAGQGAVFVWSAKNGVMGYPTPASALSTAPADNDPYSMNIQITEYAALILLVLTLGTTKLSLLWFLRRIFVAARRTAWDYITIFLIVLISIWTVAYFLAFTLLCGRSPWAFWSSVDNEETYCLSVLGGEADVEMSCGITDTFFDLVCLIIPFVAISRLHLKLKQKIAVSAIFAVGFMTLGAALARLILWMQTDLTPVFPQDLDVNLVVAAALWWGMVESGLAYFASQMPALSPLLSSLKRQQIVSSLRYAMSLLSLSSAGRRGSKSQREDDIESASRPASERMASMDTHDEEMKHGSFAVSNVGDVR